MNEQLLLNDITKQIVNAIKNTRFLRDDDVLVDRSWIADYLGVKRTTNEKIIASHEFPKRIELTDGTTRWIKAEVIEWAKTKKAK